MSNNTPLTIVGNLTADPELRFTPSGAAVANFTVASTPKKFNKQSNEFEDGETLFMRCSVWREAAENVAESLTRGTRVVVTGNLVARSWDKDGEKRTVMEMQADEVAPSLRWATAKVTKADRRGGSSNPQGYQQANDARQSDPWAGQPQQSGGWNSPNAEDPPF